MGRQTKRRVLVGALVVIAGFVALLVVRAQGLVSRQLKVAPAQRIAVDDAAVAGRLAAAVRVRTVSHQDPDKLDADAFAAHDALLAASFPKTHGALSRETIAGHSLLYTWKGSDPALEPILLCAHIDVVPIEPGTQQKWEHPPFRGDIADGYVWGRGAMDDKGSLLAILEALEALIAKGFAPRRGVVLAFGHDEEIGGAGAEAIAATLSKRGLRFAMVLDEGSAIVHDMVPGIKKPVALVGIAEKGYLTLRITARAKGGHSSMPPASTAAGKVARAVRRLEAAPMPPSLAGPLHKQFDYLGPEMPFGMRIAMANRWLLSGVLIKMLASRSATNAQLRTTTAVTMLQASVKENVLPTSASAVVNFRIKPGDTIQGVKRHVETVTLEDGIEVEIVGKASEPTPVSPVPSATFERFQRTIQAVFPEVIVAPSLVVAMTDARKYTGLSDNVYRFAPMRIGPSDLGRVHGTNERLAVKNYVELVQFYAQLIQDFAGD